MNGLIVPEQTEPFRGRDMFVSEPILQPSEEIPGPQSDKADIVEGAFLVSSRANHIPITARYMNPNKMNGSKAEYLSVDDAVSFNLTRTDVPLLPRPMWDSLVPDAEGDIDDVDKWLANYVKGMDIDN